MKKNFVKPSIMVAQVEGLHDIIATSPNGGDDPAPANVTLKFSNTIWNNGTAD